MSSINSHSASTPKVVAQLVVNGSSTSAASCALTVVCRNDNIMGCTSKMQSANPPIRWCAIYILFRPPNSDSIQRSRDVKIIFRQNNTAAIIPDRRPMLVRVRYGVENRALRGVMPSHITIGSPISTINIGQPSIDSTRCLGKCIF